jgi:hypothetical protein
MQERWVEWRFSFYSFLISAIDELSGQRHASAALYPWERIPGTHWTWGWVGPRAGLDRQARVKQGSNTGRPVIQSLVRLIELTKLHDITTSVKKP